MIGESNRVGMGAILRLVGSLHERQSLKPTLTVIRGSNRYGMGAILRLVSGLRERQSIGLPRP